MNNKPTKPAPSPAVFGSDLAPIVYFDGVICSGVCGGVIQIEVAANQLVPIEIGKPNAKVRPVVTAHLRCSPMAAADLLNALAQLLSPKQEGKTDAG